MRDSHCAGSAHCKTASAARRCKATFLFLCVPMELSIVCVAEDFSDCFCTARADQRIFARQPCAHSLLLSAQAASGQRGLLCEGVGASMRRRPRRSCLDRGWCGSRSVKKGARRAEIREMSHFQAACTAENHSHSRRCAPVVLAKDEFMRQGLKTLASRIRKVVPSFAGRQRRIARRWQSRRRRSTRC